MKFDINFNETPLLRFSSYIFQGDIFLNKHMLIIVVSLRI